MVYPNLFTASKNLPIFSNSIKLVIWPIHTTKNTLTSISSQFYPLLRKTIKFENLDLELAENMPDQWTDLSQIKDITGDPKRALPSTLPDGVYHVQNGMISAHPEIFKVKMLAKKNVRTISTMSSSNYDNSDNSSNFGNSSCFKVN